MFETGGVSLRQISSRTFASVNFEEKADIFGDLGDKKYDRVALDEDERKEEEFLKNEAKRPRRLVPSAGKYAAMIKAHIKSGDLKAGVGVLEQVRKDRSKPDNYMYNLLIRAFAVQGNIKKCFSLYNQMKKQDLKPTLATYTSLLNACANCANADMSLEKLNYARQLLIEKDVQLNAAHYNAMIKAYGRHGKLFEAFQLVDEMKDKKLTIGISTFNFLLQGTISDKEAGFRHALLVWQLLRNRKLKPDIFTFNIFLRTARDCKLGNFKIDDLLVSHIPGEAKALYTVSDRTNLMAHPPEVCPNLPLLGNSENVEPNSADDSVETTTGSTELRVDNRSDLELELADATTPIVHLESSSPETNLLLVGGFNNFVDQMKADNVKPDIKTVTYLMELVPPTLAAEKTVINYAKSMGIQLDVSFYNLLIRKRSFRFDYSNALKVLPMMQQDNLEPNIMTWGVLALTCRNGQQARELFEGMELSGHRMNVQIIGAILSQASTRWLFGLILELMEKMRVEGPRPNDKIYEILESFRKKAAEVSRDKNSPEFVRQAYWMNGYRKFNLRYSTWLKEIKEDSENKKKTKSF